MAGARFDNVRYGEFLDQNKKRYRYRFDLPVDHLRFELDIFLRPAKLDRRRHELP